MRRGIPVPPYRVRTMKRRAFLDILLWELMDRRARIARRLKE